MAILKRIATAHGPCNPLGYRVFHRSGTVLERQWNGTVAFALLLCIMLCMPRESTDAFTARLKADGRFDEFKAMRMAREAHGMSKKQAWEGTAKDFGWGGGGSSQRAIVESGAVTVTKESFDGKESSIRGDFEWVYRHQSVEDVEPSDSPSSGAWGLLQFARSDPRSFYLKWMDIVSKGEDKDEIMEGFREDARRATTEIAEMLDEFRSVLPEGSEGIRGESGVSSLDLVEGG